MAEFNALMQTYTVDFASNNNFLFIPAIQSDGYGSRYVIINLVSNGQPFSVPKDSVRVLIEGRKTDGTQVMDYCEVMDDETSVKVNITPQMIASPGKNKFEIAIISLTENTVLTSFPLYIMASERAFDMDQAISSDDYQVFVRYINDMDVTLSTIDGAEAARNSNEATRQSNENKRVSAENTRVSAENTRKSNETSRSSAEADRIKAETARVNAENARQGNETVRISNEDTRKQQESSRVAAENTRIANENKRISAETGRANAESSRVSAEQSRVSEESKRVTAENARATAESGRVNAENSRVSAENTRQSNEDARSANETQRVNTESERNSAEESRTSNETARQNAESARVTEWENLKSEVVSATNNVNQTVSDVQTKAANGDFSASIASVAAITGEPSSEAMVENIGTAQNAEFIFTIPRGADGKDGLNGKDGVDGSTPFINGDGNWQIGDVDTGIKAAGADGKDGKDGLNGTDGIVDSSLPIEFTEAEARENIITGEDLGTLFGKVSKHFSDLQPVAFSGSYNDLSDVPESNTNAVTYTEVGVITVSENTLADLDLTDHKKLYFVISYEQEGVTHLSFMEIPIGIPNSPVLNNSNAIVYHMWHTGNEVAYLPITLASDSISINNIDSLNHIPDSVMVYYVD